MPVRARLRQGLAPERPESARQARELVPQQPAQERARGRGLAQEQEPPRPERVPLRRELERAPGLAQERGPLRPRVRVWALEQEPVREPELLPRVPAASDA